MAKPGSEYSTYFTPASGKAHDIYFFLKVQSVVKENGGRLMEIRADGAAVNTGKNGGTPCLHASFK